MANEQDQSIPSLVRGVLDDGRELIREEIALAKAEARVELGRAASAAAEFAGAAVAGWFAATFILVAVALGISYGFGWPDWVGFGIVGVVVGIIGSVLF